MRDGAVVGVVRPRSLLRVRAERAQRDVGGAAGLAGADPRALVGVLLAVVRAAGVVGPAPGRVLVGHHLVPLVAECHSPAVEQAGAAGVDEVDATARTG